MKVRKFLMLAASVGLVFGILSGCGGGGGSSDSVTNTSSESTTQTVGETGGVVELSSGFKVTFWEGATSTSLPVTVSEVSLPGALPDGVEIKSPVFKIDADVDQLNLPAELEFPAENIDATTIPGQVAVYRWNEGTLEWNYVGGVFDDGVVKANVDSFSMYAVGVSSLYVGKPVELSGTNVSFHMIVKPYEYTPTFPYENIRIAQSAAAIIWLGTAPGDLETDQADRTIYLPGGSYSLCAEWYDDDDGFDNQWYHKLLGDLANDNPAIIIDQYASDSIPQNFSVGSDSSSTAQVGRCPDLRIIVSTEDAAEFDFLGQYDGLSLEPERTYDEYHSEFIFNVDGTLLIEEWALDGTNHNTGTGVWSFDESTGLFTFDVDGSDSYFSGTLSGTTDSFILTGEWFNGDPAEMQFTRP